MRQVGVVVRAVGPSSALMLTALCFAAVCHAAVNTQVVDSDYGTLHLAAPENPAKGLVIYVAPNGAWNADSDQLASTVAGQGYVVAGIPADAFQTSSKGAETAGCRGLVKDLTGLAHWVATRDPVPEGGLPILLGESQGASLVYGALVQAPAGTFHAALTLDFCPTMAIPMTLCATQGQPLVPAPDETLVAVKRVETPWFAFDTGRESSCPEGAQRAFVAAVDNARLVWGRSQGGAAAPVGTAGATGTTGTAGVTDTGGVTDLSLIHI